MWGTDRVAAIPLYTYIIVKKIKKLIMKEGISRRENWMLFVFAEYNEKLRELKR